MSDLLIQFGCETTQCPDLVIECGDLVLGGDLSTAIAMSLFTDARAKPDDVLPNNNTDPRGWWGMALDGENFGSRLWLLESHNATPQVLTLAKSYAEEALKWLTSDGVASKIQVSTSYDGCCAKQLNIDVKICKPTGQNLNWRWRYSWDLGAVEQCPIKQFDC